MWIKNASVDTHALVIYSVAQVGPPMFVKLIERENTFFRHYFNATTTAAATDSTVRIRNRIFKTLLVLSVRTYFLFYFSSRSRAQMECRESHDQQKWFRRKKIKNLTFRCTRLYAVLSQAGQTCKYDRWPTDDRFYTTENYYETTM